MYNQSDNGRVERRAFPEEIRRNRYRLYLALLAYALLTLAAGQATGRAFLRFADPDEYYAQRDGVGFDGMPPAEASLFGYANQVTLAIMLLAWVQYRRMSLRGDQVLLSLVAAHPLQEQQLLNTSQEMAIAAGIAVPRVQVVESSDLNAFSCAPAHGPATIALTRGLLDQLSREQIQGVVAHETAHIRNGDARLLTLMMGMGRVFHLISALALGPLRALFDAGQAASEEDQEGANGAAESPPTNTEGRGFWDRPATTRGVLLAVLATPVIALTLLAISLVVSVVLLLGYAAFIIAFPWLVVSLAAWELLRDHLPALNQRVEQFIESRGYLGLLIVLVPGGLILGPAILVLGVLVPVLLVLTRLAVSRNREFQADAVAVQLTRDPGGLRTALLKIEELRSGLSTSAALPGALSPMTIVPARRSWVQSAGLGWLNRLLSTHPPLQERLARLAAMESAPVAESPA